MEKKINIAELLKDCPQGMELDCTINNDVKFIKICSSSRYPIILRTKNGYEITLTKYGQVHDMDDSKCVIFPKGKTTWERFQRPFKDGDVVFYNDTISIFKEWGDETLIRTHVCTYLCAEILDINVPLFGKSINREIRYATEEEKQELFQAIKANGYKWNPKTKTLERLPKFKVGDRIKLNNSRFISTITDLLKDRYRASTDSRDLYEIEFERQDAYELVPNKFDISTLKPFDKVLVREDNKNLWKIQFFERLNNVLKDTFVCMGGYRYHQCIPYKGNEYLHNTNNEPNDFYKTWKNEERR